MAHTVLVVEDDDDIRDAIVQLLGTAGHSVVTASNGQEGMEALASSALPSLILLDIMMPRLDGWGLLEAMERNARMREIPVVVLSAFINRAKLLSAAALIGRPVMFLKKPVDLKILLQVVKRHLTTEPRSHVT